MKRFTIVAVLLLMAAMPMMAERVTPETARKVAQTFLNNNGAKSALLTDLSKAADFPNLYIFNAEQGFVVMSADDCVQPILGYSLTGRFVAENMPTNISGWLRGYNDEIQYAIENQMKATTETAKLWKDLINGDTKAAKATVVVDALIQTTWDQDPGYNDLCPYDSNAGELTVTGCVATAMAQIMRYWEYPSHGVGSHSYTPSTHPEYGTQSVNYATATYDWTEMPLHSSSSEIAKLMYHCGVSVNMDYDVSANGGSGAYSSDIPNALTTYFNYKSGVSFKNKSSYSSNNWINLIKTELNAGRPVEYNGSGSGGGHAFVCDGYDNANYFHFNWGWSGSNDGFYSLSNLTPGSGGSGGGSYSFTSSQSAVIGIQPKDCTASSPTNFNVTSEGRTATLTWNAANNAVSYSIYRNGSLIANTTETTYTDSNLAYGTYAYYIKSRDDNGAASSPTASVTVTIEPVPTNLTITQNGNGAILNWTEPEWTVPQTDNEVLTYGDGSLAYSFGAGGGTNLYFGHKYPASMINSNKVLYKVSFHATEIGAFALYVYTANAGNNKPQTQVYTQSISVSATGWNDIVLNNPLQLNASKDLWVFIYDPEGKEYPMGAGVYSGSDNYGNYATSNPTGNPNPQDGLVMLIRTCITDGSFFYNLYDNNTSIASNISGTSYTLSNIANNTAHQYTLKTNFNNGLTNASNMVGLTLGTATLSSLNLGANDKMTITEGSQLTVSGTMSNNNAENLIIENGAQLVHSSDGVKATVKKDITAYSGERDNWHFIASPALEDFTPSAENGLLSGTYDLYYYDEPTHYWMNHKIGAFDLAHKQGYLYANNAETTLQFEGTLAPSNSAISISGLSHSAESLNGFNLVGNPFACNATVNQDCYVIDGSQIILATANPELAPCEGVMVKANSDQFTVTFTASTGVKANGNGQYFDLVVCQDKTILDRARVRLGEGINMEKFGIDSKKGTTIALWQDGQEFAVAYTDGQNEMPLNFKATQNGTYTVNFETRNLELSYLHLIDNLTGNDIDLLATPSYTFEAETSNYASRFRLVFAPEEEGAASQDLIFYANGQLQVFNENEAQLQIVDVMGRILSTETIQGNYKKALNLNEGIYVVRLIKGSEVKTLRIVVH